MVEVGTRIVCVEIFEHCVRRGGRFEQGLWERWYDECAHALPWTASRVLEG